MKPVVALVVWLVVCASASLQLAAQPDNEEVAITGFGDTECRWGRADCNRCAVDVVRQVENLRFEPWSRVTYRSGAGTRLEGMEAEMLPLVTRGDGEKNKGHVQGFNRLPGVGENEWIVASLSSHKPRHPGRPAGLLLARMGGVDGASGTPLRSEERDPDAFWVEGQIPGGPLPPPDRASVAFHRIGATKHPGGFQRIGRIVAVPNYCNGPEQAECTERLPVFPFFRPTAFVELVEIASDDADPGRVTTRQLGRLSLGDTGFWLQPRKKAYYAAISRQDDGHYVLMVNRSDLGVMQFFVSSNTIPGSATVWHPRGDRRLFHWARFLPAFVTVYQNMNFVTDCASGRLFALGLRQKRRWKGENRVHLFSAEPRGRNLKLRRIANVPLAEPDDACEMRGGAGVFVTPGGQIVIYCSQGRSREKSKPPRDDQDPRLLNFSEFVASPPSTCGDGTVDREREECDDGNVLDGACTGDGTPCSNPGGACANGGLCDFDGCSRYCGETSTLLCDLGACRVDADCETEAMICEAGCCVFAGPD